MKKIISVFILMLVSLSSQATELNGTFAIKTPSSFFGSSSSISANIDVINNTFTMGAFKIYGVAATATTEYLLPGTYTRSYVLSTGEVVTRTETIPNNLVGAYLVISTNGSEYQAFLAWSISVDGSTYSNIRIPGNTLIGSTLNGAVITANLNTPPSSISVSVNVAGGNTQECAQKGGTVVTFSSTTSLTGTAVVDRIDWFLDGVLFAQGANVSQFIPLGDHTLTTTGVTTTGLTNSVITPLTIKDTTSPTLTIAFLDDLGNVITSATDGNVHISLTASDICDLNPIITSGAAIPITNVVDGDIITINGVTNDVQLPTTGVEVTAQATDASGRTTFKRGQLSIQ